MIKLRNTSQGSNLAFARPSVATISRSLVVVFSFSCVERTKRKSDGVGPLSLTSVRPKKVEGFVHLEIDLVICNH